MKGPWDRQPLEKVHEQLNIKNYLASGTLK